MAISRISEIGADLTQSRTASPPSLLLERSRMVTSDGNPMTTMDEALKRVGVGNDLGCRELYAILFLTFWESLIRFLRYRREATLEDAQDSVSNLLLSLYERALAGKFVDPPRRWQGYLRRAAFRQYEMDIRKARRAIPRAR